MNALELADKQAFEQGELSMWIRNETATMLRQQQAEIEALKKQCLDEIFKTTYADQNAKVMEQYWQEAQAEIEALKDFAIWMTGCEYDFTQHDYFIKCRDELLVGKAQEK